MKQPIKKSDSKVRVASTNVVLYDDTKTKFPVKGSWDPVSENVFIPEVHKSDVIPWLPAVRSLTRMFPDTLFIVSSVVLSVRGLSRSGSSHHDKLACDVAPMYSKTHVLNPSGRNPRLSEQLATLAFLANHLDHVNFDGAVVAEGDHWHLDKRFRKGIYSYPVHRADYANDAAQPDAAHQVTEKGLYLINKRGEFIRLN